jgi:putative sugar O-methyltransferase
MKTKYALLNMMLEDMDEQSSLYKPTAFWQHGSQMLIDELQKESIENFREHTMTRTFFVPGYSAIEYFSNKEQYDPIIEQFDSYVKDKRFVTRLKRLFVGYSSAQADYRVLNASDIDKIPYTNRCSESKVGKPVEQHHFYGRNFSRSMLNYALGLNFLKQNVDTGDIRTVMEIGGGFGTLGEILLSDDRNKAFYINADIPPVLFYSTYYLQEVFGKENVADYSDLKKMDSIDIVKLKEKYKALNLASWQIEKLEGKIDLFVNFISFQEMEPDVVQNYCNHIDRLQPKYILLRNMLEGKRKRDENFLSGVDEPILGEDYDKFLPNYKLVASDSSIYGFVTEDGFHSQLRIYQRR